MNFSNVKYSVNSWVPGKELTAPMQLTQRQLEIVEIVKKFEPITGEQIAEMLNVSRPTIRSDLAVLVMLGLLDAKPKVGYFLGSRATAAGEAIKRLHEKRVKDVQSVPVIVRESTTVQDAVITMFLEDVGNLTVVGEQGELTGVVSRKDILKLTLGNASAPQMPISMVMTRRPKIITVAPEDAVIDACAKMIHHQVDSLPVVDESDAVIGSISTSTMAKVLLELATSELSPQEPDRGISQ
jgi:CBS domain-containing protein